MRLLYVMLLSTVLLTSCKKNEKVYEPIVKNSSIHQVKVKEVIQGGTYTFLLVNENNKEYWMAVGKTDVKAEDIVYFENALLMKDFESKELDRVFDEILFVERISDSPQKTKPAKSLDAAHNKRNPEVPATESIHVDPAPGGITIGELFKNRTKYENKKVIIRGQVVRINNNIMDRNWVHLKDGTSHDGKSDLTFTTMKVVENGDVVTFEGTVALDKEYGAGYVYPIVVEGAYLK